MTIITGSEVIEVREDETCANNDNSTDDEKKRGKKHLIARERSTGKIKTIIAEEVLIAAGRGPNTDVLHAERAGIKTDENGRIVVNEYLETSQPNIWAFGDANGVYPFKHKANYEAELVHYNAVLSKDENRQGEEKKNKASKMKKDYHAIPQAVFTHPEIASVGLREGSIGKLWQK
jgi:dihydrolipoamide dehydrogenase